MYQIQMLFRNDLSNPIATDLGGEIDVSFIIATHFSFLFFFVWLSPFLSADHKTSHHSSFILSLIFAVMKIQAENLTVSLIVSSTLTVDHK